MSVFLNLAVNLLPLYGLIALGFCAGRFFNVDRQTLANLALFIFMPAVVFGFVAQLDLRPAYALLPAVIFMAHAIVGLSMLRLGRFIYGDARANLLSMCASMGNGGYFGLPLVLLLFAQQWVGVYMFMLLGGVLYEGTIGYYIAARGKFSVRDSLRKLVRFPSVYAISAGLAVNLAGWELPDLALTYWTYFKGAYVITGMMIVGAALAQMEKFVFSIRFSSLAFAGKFVFWPALVLGFVTLDRNAFHLFEPEVLKLMIVFSLVPPAANIAAFAAQFDIAPEKAATTVLAGTVLALLTIPATLALTWVR